MRCWLCSRIISRADAPKRVEWRRQQAGADMKIVLYGAGESPLESARGQLVKAAHGKCYWVWHKQSHRPMSATRSEEHLEEQPGEDD